MSITISRDRAEETVESKFLWFRSLTLDERMDMPSACTELLLMIHPKIVEQKNVVAA